MNYGIDSIITKVMEDSKATAEMESSVVEILRIASRIEAMFAKPAPTVEKTESVPMMEIPKQRIRHKHRVYTINGKTKTIDEWCEEYGMCRSTVEKRIYGQKMTLEEALNQGISKPGTNKITVIQCDPLGKQVRKFDSVSKTARELHVPICRVNRALQMTPAEQINTYGYYLMTA